MLLVIGVKEYVSERSGVSRVVITVGCLFAATYVMYIPPFMDTYGILSGIIGNFVQVLRVITIDADITQYYDAITAGTGNSIGAQCYIALLGILHVSLPALSALTAVTVLFRCFSAIQVYFANRRKRPLFVFSEINERSLHLINDKKLDIKHKELAVYAVLFVFVILSIFRVVPHVVTLALVILSVLIVDRTRFKYVDYALLATFCVFFVFSGNIARITVIKDFIAGIVGAKGENVLVAGIVSCQFISNVPTAIFLSKFTDPAYCADLLVAVNVGSLGIIISSLASLITLKEYLKHQPQGFKRYMLMFTAINTTFLIVQLIVTFLRR